jgi:hypothetical protein
MNNTAEEDNPFFKGPAKTFEPLELDAEAGRSNGALSSIVLQSLRFVLSCFAFIVFPLVVAPYCKKMFEEFGLDLPVLTLLLFSISRQIIGIVSIYVPIVFVALAGIEIFVYRMPKSLPRTLLNILLWLVVLLTLAFSIISCWIPYQAVVSGLTA